MLFLNNTQRAKLSIPRGNLFLFDFFKQECNSDLKFFFFFILSFVVPQSVSRLFVCFLWVFVVIFINKNKKKQFYSILFIICFSFAILLLVNNVVWGKPTTSTTTKRDMFQCVHYLFLVRFFFPSFLEEKKSIFPKTWVNMSFRFLVTGFYFISFFFLNNNNNKINHFNLEKTKKYKIK